jgi:hypothetical protein
MAAPVVASIDSGASGTSPVSAACMSAAGSMVAGAGMSATAGAVVSGAAASVMTAAAGISVSGATRSAADIGSTAVSVRSPDTPGTAGSSDGISPGVSAAVAGSSCSVTAGAAAPVATGGAAVSVVISVTGAPGVTLSSGAVSPFSVGEPSDRNSGSFQSGNNSPR